MWPNSVTPANVNKQNPAWEYLLPNLAMTEKMKVYLKYVYYERFSSHRLRPYNSNERHYAPVYLKYEERQSRHNADLVREKRKTLEKQFPPVRF